MRGLLVLAVILGWGASFSAFAQDDHSTRIIHDSIEVDPQAEMKAPTAKVENAGAGVSEPMVIIVEGRRYVIPSIYSASDDLRGHYNKLTPEYQQLFHTNRVIFLTRAAQILSTSMLGNVFGTGAIVKDRVRWSWDHMREFMRPHQNVSNQQIDRWLRGQGHPGVRMEIEAAIARELEAKQEAQLSVEQQALILKTFKEHRHDVIQRILLSLDRNFFSRPALVANSNEVGVFASLGVTAFMGAKFKETKKGFGGSLDIGVFIGWNKTDSSAVVQFFRLTEKFRGTMTAVTGNAAIVPKWGMMFASTQRGTETATERGTVHYPPTPPGVSSFFLTSPNRFAVGMNPPIGLIPWPLDSVLVYSMDYVMKPSLRIALRFEVLKDFIKIETGPKGEFRGAMKTSVRRTVQWVQAKAAGRSMCVGLHAQ